MNEFIRVLKPDGKIVIADICAPEKWRTLSGKILMFLVLCLSVAKKHKGEAKSKVLTLNEWKKLLENMGLKIVKTKEFVGKKDPHWEMRRVIISAKK